MAKTDRPDELAAYVAFQRAVAEGFEEGARFDTQDSGLVIVSDRQRSLMVGE